MAEYNHRGLEDFRSNIYQFDRYHYNDYLLQPRPCHNVTILLLCLKEGIVLQRTEQ